MYPDSVRQAAAAGIMNDCQVFEQVPDPDLRKHLLTCHERNRDSILQTEPDAYADLLRMDCKLAADYRVNRAFFDQLRLASAPGRRFVSFLDRENFSDFRAPWIEPPGGGTLERSVALLQGAKNRGRLPDLSDCRLIGGEFRIFTTNLAKVEQFFDSVPGAVYFEHPRPETHGTLIELNADSNDWDQLASILMIIQLMHGGYLLPLGGFQYATTAYRSVQLSAEDLAGLQTRADAWI